MKYQPGDDWDLHLDIAYKSIDVTLVLPHYRARNQPIDHRMNMFIGNESAPVRVKVVSFLSLPKVLGPRI